MESSKLAPNMRTTRGEIWMGRSGIGPTVWCPTSDSADGQFGVNLDNLADYLSKKKPIQDGKKSSIYSATIKNTGTVVAVKEYVTKNKQHAQAELTKMNEELRPMRSLAHLHVIEAIGSYITKDSVAFIMSPYVENNLEKYLALSGERSLRELEALWGPVAPDLAPTLMGCLAHALSFIHARKIKHKDIKPQNILLHGKRVIIIDFDISHVFEDRSTTFGTSSKTCKYASPEVNRGDPRGTDQDVYSLACVFFELFAAHKGFSADELIDKENLFRPGTNTYASNMDQVINWVSQKVRERCDIQFLCLLRAMVRKNPKDRLRAPQVWQELVTMRSNAGERFFCGMCCMPHNPHHLPCVEELPSPLFEDIPKASGLSQEASGSCEFETKYEHPDVPPYTWSRILRVAGNPFTCLESVGPGGTEGNYWCRKTFWAANVPDDRRKQARQEAKQAALAESRLLHRLSHQHIVKVKATYRYGKDTLALLTTPVTRFDLSQYLSLVELTSRDSNNLGDWNKILRISPGCLASAVTHLHEKKIIHGDISPENILVAPDVSSKIILANFGISALKERDNYMRASSFGEDIDESPHIKHNPYASPDYPKFKMIAYSDDIFSLGCVYVEMETVRTGKTLQEMRAAMLQKNNSLEMHGKGGHAQKTSSHVRNTQKSSHSTVRRERDYKGKGRPAHKTQEQPGSIQYENYEETYDQLFSGTAQRRPYSDPDQRPGLEAWIDGLQPHTEVYSRLVRRMIHQNPDQRPSAPEVLSEISRCRPDPERPLIMCGEGCLPRGIEVERKRVVESDRTSSNS